MTLAQFGGGGEVEINPLSFKDQCKNRTPKLLKANKEKNRGKRN